MYACLLLADLPELVLKGWRPVLALVMTHALIRLSKFNNKLRPLYELPRLWCQKFRG